MEQSKSHCHSKSFSLPIYLKLMLAIALPVLNFPEACPCCALYKIAQRVLLKWFGLRAALSWMCAAFRKAPGAVLHTDQRELLLPACLPAAGISYLPHLLGKSSAFHYLAAFFSVHFYKWQAIK